jgi:hypothetical protein
MSRRMDALVKDATPIADHAVRAFELDGEAELLDALLAQERPATAAATAPRVRAARPRITRARLSLAGAAAVGALALGGVSLTGGGELRTGPERAWAAQALRVAGAIPRIAIGDDGWSVTRADELGVGRGEVDFGDGTITAQLSWLPSRWHNGMVEDRALSGDRLADVPVLGTSAAVFRYRNSGTDDLTALWRSGRYALELHATARPGAQLTDARFAALLRALKLVSVDEWLGAIPASAVLPSARETTVLTMLRGIPLPHGFDATALTQGAAVRDRYQLGAVVSGAVACAWLDQWSAARRSGDDAAAQAAGDAMATSRDWPVLRAMQAEGDFPGVVWEYADAIAGDGTVLDGAATVQASYPDALGCDAR